MDPDSESEHVPAEAAAPAPGDAWGTAKAFLEVGKLVLPLVGIGIYGFARVAHDSFAGEFDLTTEEMGITYSDILSRAAVTFSVYFSLGILVVGLLLAGVTIKSSDPSIPTREKGWKQPGERFFLAFAPIVGAFVPLLLALSLPSIPGEVLNLLEADVGAWMIWALLVVGALLVPPLFARRIWKRLESFLETTEDMGPLISAAVLIVASLTVLGFMLAAERGDDIASTVRDGRIPTIGEFELLDVHPIPVCTNSTLNGVLSEEKAYFLLGSSESRLILFEPEEGVVKVPADGLSITEAEPDPSPSPAIEKITELGCN